MTNEQLARLFHKTYEKLAPLFDYETRTETREFDPDSRNGQLMVAVCAHVRAALSACPVPAEAPAGAVARVVHLRQERERRIYIAGPMTGLPDFNFPAFNAAAERLRGEGWQVENPAEHGQVAGANWSDYLRWDLSRLVQCAAVYLLPGWERSKGATLENTVARTLGLKIVAAEAAASTAPAPAQEPVCSACNGTGETVTCCGNTVAGAHYMGSTEWVCCGNPDRDSCSRCTTTAPAQPAEPAPSAEAQTARAPDPSFCRSCGNTGQSCDYPECLQAPTAQAELTDAQIEKGWHATFSTSNPFCPCNLKSFTKAARWAERALKEQS